MNTSKENRAYQLYKVKFCNGEANRKRLFDELKGHSDKLEKLLDSSDKDASLLKQRSMAANGAAIEASICNFWHQATRVFKALSATLSNCKCQDHTASLLLQHRTSRKPEFHVFFVGSLLRPACWELRRTRIVEGSDPRPVSQDMWKENLKAESLSPHDPSHRQTQPFLKSAMRSSSSSTLNIKTMATEKTKYVTTRHNSVDTYVLTSAGLLGLLRSLLATLLNQNIQHQQPLSQTSAPFSGPGPCQGRKPKSHAAATSCLRTIVGTTYTRYRTTQNLTA